MRTGTRETMRRWRGHRFGGPSTAAQFFLATVFRAAGFLAAGFFAAGFLAAGFFAAAGFAAGFFAAAGCGTSASTTVVSTSFAAAASFRTEAMPLIAARFVSYGSLAATT